jgi:hypothetical protein
MKKIQSLFLALLLIAGLGSTAHAGRNDRTLIVMPVRYTVVQFAFDVARMRPVQLLAYDRGTGDEPLLLHVWDAATKKWAPADITAYQNGSLFTATPKRTFLVGGEADLPADLAAPGWAKDVTPIPSLKVLDMANTMNKDMKFSRREWKKLASRHNLDLVEENHEERRYGRYGKPGTKYEGPRAVNPLVARLRSLKKDKPAMEAAVEDAVEDAIEVEKIEEDEETSPAPAEEAMKPLPASEGDADAEATAKTAAVVEAAMSPDEK